MFAASQNSDICLWLLQKGSVRCVDLVLSLGSLSGEGFPGSPGSLNKGVVLVNLSPSPDGGDYGMGMGGGVKGRVGRTQQGVWPWVCSQGGARQQGHPVPLREGGELAPLSHPVLSSIPAKSEKENERGTKRNRSQLSPKVLRSALSRGPRVSGVGGSRGHQGSTGTWCVPCVSGGLQEMLDNRCQEGGARRGPFPFPWAGGRRGKGGSGAGRFLRTGFCVSLQCWKEFSR